MIFFQFILVINDNGINTKFDCITECSVIPIIHSASKLNFRISNSIILQDGRIFVLEALPNKYTINAIIV